jgi:molybdopterin-synthase adenylyltransferase
MKNADRTRFKQVGERGNERLQDRTVAIAGLGSIGSIMAAMLCRENIGLRLIDMGRVEETDMHRLALFLEEDITKFKVKQAKVRLTAISPAVPVKSFHEEIINSNVFLLEGDVIVDTTNNDEINALVLAHAVKKKLPLIIARASGSKANILVLQKGPPAKIISKITLPSVEKDGIFSPATHMAASVAVAEVMRILTGSKESKLISIDSWNPKVKVTKI